MTDKLLVPFEHEGLWWEPERPDARLSGTLSYDPVDGCKLSLLGQFSPAESLVNPLLATLPVLHGVLKIGRKVSLFENLSAGFHIRAPGISTESYWPNIALLGDHIDSLDNYYTSECEFSLTNLEEWLDHKPFGLKYKQGNSKKFTLKVQLPEPLSFPLPHINSTLTTAASYETRGGDVREFTVRAPSWLILKSGQAQTLQDHLEVVSRTRNFVALCLGERAYVSNLILRGAEEEITPGVTEKCRIECFYRQNPNPQIREKRVLRSGIRLTEFGLATGEILDRWFVLYDKIAEPLDILFALLYSDMYLSIRFLLAAQAAEALHRHLLPSTYIDETQYEEIRQELVDSIPDQVSPNLKAKLEGVLKYGNELSLRRRLKEISERLAEKEAGDIVRLDAAFINDVVNNRNYLTHYDKSLQEKAKTGEALYELYAKLTLTIMVVVFAELDAPMNLVKKYLQRHRLFGRYVET